MDGFGCRVFCYRIVRLSLGVFSKGDYSELSPCDFGEEGTGEKLVMFKDYRLYSNIKDMKLPSNKLVETMLLYR